MDGGGGCNKVLLSCLSVSLLFFLFPCLFGLSGVYRDLPRPTGLDPLTIPLVRCPHGSLAFGLSWAPELVGFVLIVFSCISELPKGLGCGAVRGGAVQWSGAEWSECLKRNPKTGAVRCGRKEVGMSQTGDHKISHTPDMLKLQDSKRSRIEMD